MNQPSLLHLPVRFDSGVELTAADYERLTKQIDRVHAVLALGQWMTVEQIKIRIRDWFSVTDPENSISAQCRNLRKQKFGGYQIERRRVGNVYEYRKATHG